MRITPSPTISSRPAVSVLYGSLLLLSGLMLLSLIAVAQESAPAPAAPAAPAASAPAPKPQVVLPEGEGKDIVAKKCTVCHTPVRIVQSARSEDEWRDLVQTMVDRGADVSPEEADTVVKYLSKNFPPKASGTGAAPAAGTSAPAAAATTASAPAGATSTAEEVSAAGAPSPSAKINLNTASSADLKSTLGLTEQEAESIIQYRTQGGSFKSWDDVAKVPGLGKKTLDAIKDRVTFQ